MTKWKLHNFDLEIFFHIHSDNQACILQWSLEMIYTRYKNSSTSWMYESFLIFLNNLQKVGKKTELGEKITIQYSSLSHRGCYSHWLICWRQRRCQRSYWWLCSWEKWWQRNIALIKFISLWDFSWDFCLKWWSNKQFIHGCDMVTIYPTYFRFFFMWSISNHGMRVHKATFVMQTYVQCTFVLQMEQW